MHIGLCRTSHITNDDFGHDSASSENLTAFVNELFRKIIHTVIIAYDFDHILNYEEKEKTYACKIGDGSVRTAKGYDVWCADPDHYRSERPDRGKL